MFGCTKFKHSTIISMMMFCNVNFIIKQLFLDKNIIKLFDIFYLSQHFFQVESGIYRWHTHSGLFFWTPLKIPNLRSSYWSCSVNKMFLKILHWETPVLKSLFNRVAEHWCFPVEFAKFLRTPILKNICKRQLLKSVVLLGLPFLITSGSNWYLCFNFFITIYRFVCWFFLHYCW